MFPDDCQDHKTKLMKEDNDNQQTCMRIYLHGPFVSKLSNANYVISIYTLRRSGA